MWYSGHRLLLPTWVDTSNNTPLKTVLACSLHHPLKITFCDSFILKHSESFLCHCVWGPHWRHFEEPIHRGVQDRVPNIHNNVHSRGIGPWVEMMVRHFDEISQKTSRKKTKGLWDLTQQPHFTCKRRMEERKWASSRIQEMDKNSIQLSFTPGSTR